MDRKVIGWWEEYACGCVSETVKRKRDLLGYCGIHGADRRHVHPELKKPVAKNDSYNAAEKWE